MTDTQTQVTNRVALWREQIEEGYQDDGLRGSAVALLDSLVDDVLEAAALKIEEGAETIPGHWSAMERVVSKSTNRAAAEAVRSMKRKTA